MISAAVTLYSDPLRTDGARAHAMSRRDRIATPRSSSSCCRLDHYFAARYELAINVWTRALFLDRAPCAARAYIDRARSALAERQRESEELLQNGVAASSAAKSGEARRLLQAAIAAGAPSEEGLAVLDRLSVSNRRCRRPKRPGPTGRSASARPMYPRRRHDRSASLPA